MVAIVGLVTVVVEVEERLTVGSDGIKQPGASLGRTIRCLVCSAAARRGCKMVQETGGTFRVTAYIYIYILYIYIFV